jgi:xanthine dehydrogenase accessory factor
MHSPTNQTHLGIQGRIIAHFGNEVKMDTFFEILKQWFFKGKRIALATVVKTWGSSPRGIGAKMAVNESGEMVGSVSGGCVEAAVVEESLGVLNTGKSKLVHYGVRDDEAWEVGLACGGEIEVFIREMKIETFERVKMAWEERQGFTIATIIQGPEEFFGEEIVVGEDASQTNFAHSHYRVLFEASKLGLKKKHSFRREYRTNSSSLKEGSDQVPFEKTLEVFVDTVNPQLQLIIIGGGHISMPLVDLANILGFQTILIDPRKKFANSKRFPEADQIINEWPQKAFEKIKLDPNTAIAVLTHDPKIDDPALEMVLVSEAFYIGALGSQKTQDERKLRLMDSGLSPDLVNRIWGPIGIIPRSQSPSEIALGILAEIIQVKHKGISR